MTGGVDNLKTTQRLEHVASAQLNINIAGTNAQE
jgi:hypothetical protein